MAKKPNNAKALVGQKRHRRQWITFIRMCRYGVNNFTRNAWLTVAATAVMTITLLIIFLTVIAQNVLSDTTDQLGKRLERSIYLKPMTTEQQASKIIGDIKTLSNVESVTYITTEQGRAEFAEKNKTSSSTLSAINIATNKIPAIIRISLKDPNNTSQLIEFVNTSKELKTYIEPSRRPSFMSNRKAATDTIASWARTAQQVGIGASVLFTSISMLIIFNTIRMAIFNRKEEIQMMKLIGADRSFIRGPFVVEAIVYGCIAAVLATAAGVGILLGMKQGFVSWGVPIEQTITLIISYIGLVLLAMIVLGAVIGTISSLLATRRYLRV